MKTKRKHPKIDSFTLTANRATEAMVHAINRCKCLPTATCQRCTLLAQAIQSIDKAAQFRDDLNAKIPGRIHKCPTCGAVNGIVNECRCAPHNLPTNPFVSALKEADPWLRTLHQILWQSGERKGERRENLIKAIKQVEAAIALDSAGSPS